MKNDLVIPGHYVYILNFREVRKWSRHPWNGTGKERPAQKKWNCINELSLRLRSYGSVLQTVMLMITLICSYVTQFIFIVSLNSKTIPRSEGTPWFFFRRKVQFRQVKELASSHPESHRQDEQDPDDVDFPNLLATEKVNPISYRRFTYLGMGESCQLREEVRRGRLLSCRTFAKN